MLIILLSGIVIIYLINSVCPYIMVVFSWKSFSEKSLLKEILISFMELIFYCSNSSVACISRSTFFLISEKISSL